MTRHRHSVRRWIMTGCILLLGLGLPGVFSANGLAADPPPSSPRAPVAAPDGTRPGGLIGDTPIFPLDEVRPGLNGVGKTVVHGTKVESFDVSVLAVLENAAPAGDLILIRVSGPVVERTGGIASGMSGSPVYIDGRLLGAIGYGFDMADPTVGMVTPISSMRSVLELLSGYRDESGPADTVIGNVTSPDEGTEKGDNGVAGDAGRAAHVTLERPVTVDGRVIEKVAFATSQEQAQALRERLGPGASVMQQVATPVLAAGWGGRSLGVLSEMLADYPVTIVGRGGGTGGFLGGVTAATSAADASDSGWMAEPGSAFGVQLIRGDVSLNAIGTITAVADDAFIGFGHPFLNMGATELYATGAAIHAVVDSMATPFKVGSVLDPIGTIFQDRGAAVAGRLGVAPSWIPVDIRVQDEGTRSIRLTQAEVADHPQLAVPLTVSAALEGFDQSIDRVGPGTAEVTFEIKADGLPTEFVRKNMYYSPTDISAYALTELLNGLDLLISNPFRELDVQHVSVDAKVTQDRHTAQIEKVDPAKDEVEAGETLDVEVTIRPFRQAPITKVVPLEIPRDTSTGDVVVTVRGGGVYFAPMDFGLPSMVAGSPPPVEPPVPSEDEDDEAADEDTDETQAEESASENLEGMVTAFVEKEQNNELIAEFYPPYQYGPPEREAGPNSSSEEAPVGDDEGADAEPADPNGQVTEPSHEDGGEHSSPSDAEASDGGAETAQDTDPAPSDVPVEPIRSSVLTEYVMEGQQHFNLHILPPTTPESATPEPATSKRR